MKRGKTGVKRGKTGMGRERGARRNPKHEVVPPTPYVSEALASIDTERLRGGKSLQDLLALLAEHRIIMPDMNDPYDVRRALIQLRDRLLIQYKHMAHMGEFPQYAEESGSPQVSHFRKAALAELARPNTKARAPRSRARRSRRQSALTPRARRNPLDETQAQMLASYAMGPVPEEQTRKLHLELERTRSGAAKQALSRGIIESMFPSEGPLTTWSPPRRFESALTKFDLISRLADMPEPDPALDGQPFSTAEATAYLTEAAGLSASEARRVLDILRDSTNRRGPGGERKAIQPSSAMCKVSRTRKLGKYKPPQDLLNYAGFDSVIILVSPVGQQPRVMTWRHGSHIDCDLVGESSRDTLRLLGRAIQISLYWLAERPKRLEKTRVFIGRVGDPEVHLVWAPGAPVSVDTIIQNLRSGPREVYGNVGQDAQNYMSAMVATFGALEAQPPRAVGKRKTQVGSSEDQELEAGSEAEMSTPAPEPAPKVKKPRVRKAPVPKAASGVIDEEFPGGEAPQVVGERSPFSYPLDDEPV